MSAYDEYLKLVERIENEDFDFIGAGGQIDMYCLQNDIPPRTKYRIRLAFEELLQQQLMPVLKRTPVRVTVAYSSAEEQAEVTASYGGERFDPAAASDDFSYNILKTAVDELNYDFDPDAEYGNTVRVFFHESIEA